MVFIIEDIMSSKSRGNYSSRDYFTLEFIPFVSATRETNDNIEEKTSSLPFTTDLSGKEASDFYKSIISAPSTAPSITSSQPQTKKQPKKKRVSQKPQEYNPGKIHTHAQNGNLDAVKEIIKNSEENVINLLDMYGWTPLMCATCEGHTSIVKFLLENNADFSIKNNQGKSAFDIAVEKEHFAIIDFFKYGSKNNETDSATNEVEEEKFCRECNLTFKDALHERSITHLFSTRKGEVTTFYHIPENNKGFQMMVKSGWDQNRGLGSKDGGRKFPIKTVFKDDRSCIGRKKEIARVTHFNAYDASAVKRKSSPSVKVVREKTLKKWQRAKLDRKTRQKEIEFRRQFLCDF